MLKVSNVRIMFSCNFDCGEFIFYTYIYFGIFNHYEYVKALFLVASIFQCLCVVQINIFTFKVFLGNVKKKIEKNWGGILWSHERPFTPPMSPIITVSVCTH